MGFLQKIFFLSPFYFLRTRIPFPVPKDHFRLWQGDLTFILGEYNYDVILMIDSSGSMYGEKLSHAVQAIKNIITALPESDNFNIIRFGNKVRTWRQYMAKSEDKVKAKVWLYDSYSMIQNICLMKYNSIINISGL